MKRSFKSIWIIMVLIANVGFTGCAKARDLNSFQSQPIQKQNPKKQVYNKGLLDVPIISQQPELKNGCEVTSLTMLLQYVGVQVDKMTLAQKIKKDQTLLVRDKNGNIQKWGDPNERFAVYSRPMIELMEEYLPGRSVDLTNQPFEVLLQSIDNKNPVIVWVTAKFKKPKEYKEWEKDGNKIRATFDEHAVLFVGYDEKYCYVNNPFTEKKSKGKERYFYKSLGYYG